MIPGIDISEWQGHVDFNAVKASGIKFVLIRAGYGRSASQADNYFAEHYTQAKAAGLQVGVYWYSYATSPADAANEARACLTVGTIPCQVDTYKNENTIFLIRPNRGNIPPRFGHFF
ncbi:hypothetical protein HCY84_08180 [Limosilactobacillus fermentum]